ncbi:hypothetical protein ACFTAO_01080 [Paenibacillus rhizoplanae]
MRMSLSRRMMNRTLVTVMLISMTALPAASAELPAAQAQGVTGNGQEVRQLPEGSYEHYLQQYEREEQPPRRNYAEGSRLYRGRGDEPGGADGAWRGDGKIRQNGGERFGGVAAGCTEVRAISHLCPVLSGEGQKARRLNVSC